MMTRKDYIKAAEIVKEEKIHNHREIMCLAFCLFFSKDNPRFDEIRFRQACGV